MRDKEMMRKVVSIIFAFFLFIVLTISVVTAGAGMTVFSVKHFQKSFDGSIYAEKNMELLLAALQKEAVNHGLPQDILSKQLQYSEFKKVLDGNIKKAAEGDQVRNDKAQEFAKIAENAIYDYFRELHVGKNSYIDITVSDITRDVASYYSDYTTLPFAEYFAAYRSSALKVIRILCPICTLLTLVAIIILIKLQEHKKERKFYISSSIFAAGLTNLIVGYIFTGRINFQFSKEIASYDSFIDGFFHSAASVFWIFGIMLVIIAMVIKLEREK